MVTVSEQQFVRDLSRWLERASKGETILIVEDTRPIARLSPPTSHWCIEESM